KNRMVNFLHIINVLKVYRTFFKNVESHLRRFLARAGRPARVLELASGSGEFMFDLAVRARRRKLSLELTGPDYLDENVQQATKKAAARRLPVAFKKIDMFELDRLADDSYDFVFITQALHHFTLQELTTVMRQASRIATYGVFALDGRRSFFSVAVLTVLGLV